MRAIKAHLNSAGKYKYKVSFRRDPESCHGKRDISQTPECAVDHLVVGAGKYAARDRTSSESDSGVVGLAVAERLTRRFPRRTTYLVERNATSGEEIRSVVPLRRGYSSARLNHSTAHATRK